MDHCITASDIEYISAALSAITLIVAVLGISTWKKELRTKRRIETLGDLQSEIIQVRVHLRRVFKGVNEYLKSQPKTVTAKLAFENLCNAELEKLILEKETLERLTLIAAPELDDLNDDKLVIVTWLSGVIYYYKNFISAISTNLSAKQIADLKDRFSDENLKYFSDLVFDYLDLMKLKV